MPARDLTLTLTLPPDLGRILAEQAIALGHFLRIGTTSIVLGAPASSRPGGRSPPEDAKRPSMRGLRPRAGFKPALPVLSEGAGDRLRSSC